MLRLVHWWLEWSNQEGLDCAEGRDVAHLSGIACMQISQMRRVLIQSLNFSLTGYVPFQAKQMLVIAGSIVVTSSKHHLSSHFPSKRALQMPNASLKPSSRSGMKYEASNAAGVGGLIVVQAIALSFDLLAALEQKFPQVAKRILRSGKEGR